MSSCSLVNFNNIEHHQNEHVVGAVIFTDLKSSSKLWGFDISKEWQEYIYDIVELHFQIIITIIDNFNTNQVNKAKIIKTIGDSTMIFAQWSFEDVLNLVLCIQNNIGRLNKYIVKDISRKYPGRVLHIYETIPEPKAGSIEEPNIFGIRIGLCYGDFSKVKTVLQNNDFEDIFGLGVNIASRMESKISSVPGAISWTYYFDNNSDFSEEIDKCLNKLPLKKYKGLVLDTTDKFIKKDIKKLLHGALPSGKDIKIYSLVPKEYNFNDFFIDNSDLKRALNNFKEIISKENSTPKKKQLFRKVSKKILRNKINKKTI